MNNDITVTKQPALTIQDMVRSDVIIKAAERALGDKSKQFLTSVLALANSNDGVAQCEPKSVYNACLIAATLDLPVNQNLGWAHIVPYKDNNRGGRKYAQFQMGYKGYVQLAMRTNQYVALDAVIVHDGEFLGLDEMTGQPRFKFDYEKRNNDIVGYMAYFELKNGFRSVVYMTVDEIEQHAKMYSQSYMRDLRTGRQGSRWSQDFNTMALKTIIKRLLNNKAPLSTELAMAIEKDQQVDGKYLDNSARARITVENARVGGADEAEVVEKTGQERPADKKTEAKQ